jgi:hypothetical protein
MKKGPDCILLRQTNISVGIWDADIPQVDQVMVATLTSTCMKSASMEQSDENKSTFGTHRNALGGIYIEEIWTLFFTLVFVTFLFCINIALHILLICVIYKESIIVSTWFYKMLLWCLMMKVLILMKILIVYLSY